jgi:hypothetical protein
MKFKYIKESELEKLEFKPRAGQIKTPERLELEAIKPKQIVVIEPKMWTIKSTPSGMLTNVAESTGGEYKTRTLANGGWVVTRLK